MDNIYSVFYEKQPSSFEDMLPKEDNKPLLCTFLNPYTAYISKSDFDLYRNFDKIGSDGFIVVLINSLLNKKKTIRVSFDMTSLAQKLFEYMEVHEQSVFFIGSIEEDISKSINVIQNSFPNLNILGYHHGFIKDRERQVARKIIALNPDVIVIGMGALIQDRFALLLRDLGSHSSIYTCGGFLHQTTNKIDYYPKWIDKLQLRAFYRLIKEPYVGKRLVLYYPRFIYNYICFLLRV